MSRPVIGVVVVALAVGAVLFFALRGDDDPASTPTPTPANESSPDAAARRFLDRYVLPDGRVQRIDEGGDTVGEGQAYGMLLAAALGDEARFDVIWKWTQDNLERPDGLISFLWQDGEVVDPEAASDADVDAARALLVASCEFDRPELRDEAVELGRAILAEQTATFADAPVLVAGPWAVEEPVTINPSYFSPATFAALGEASGDGQWGELSATSRSISEMLMNDETPLPPDWARLERDEPVPIGLPDDPEAPPKFSFDAVRTLVRLAEDPDPEGRQIAAVAWPVFEGQDPAQIAVEHDLSGEPAGDTRNPVAQVAAAGAAHAAGENAARDRLLDAAEAADREYSTYYGAAWVALGRYMLTTKALEPSC